MRRYEQLSLLLGDLIATHHTNYNGDGKPGFGIIHLSLFSSLNLRPLRHLRLIRSRFGIIYFPPPSR
ncbi:MAG: hypothetical protein HC789_13650 [Microcoleus sp. CSU_2_2]|nr:hypothetical protein [Microcoleus sp. CSU_2_2]